MIRTNIYSSGGGICQPTPRAGGGYGRSRFGSARFRSFMARFREGLKPYEATPFFIQPFLGLLLP